MRSGANRAHEGPHQTQEPARRTMDAGRTEATRQSARLGPGPPHRTHHQGNRRRTRAPAHQSAHTRAKIHNQRVMLMRNGDVPERVLKLMVHFRNATESARDLTELLGLEGNAAAIYFEQFESMLKQREDWKFDWRGRNRRPPRDPVNALLSLGYSMLAKELTGVCHAVGLDAFLGFMHQPRYGRPALALDLMEEFRPLIADSVAISLINRGELGPEDFMRNANGTFLNDTGRKRFWEAWFRRLDTDVSHPEFEYKMAC